MKLTNNTILEYSTNLSQFKNSQIKLPVRVNFFLQKNIRTILEEASQIEATRIQIGQEYGTLNDARTEYIIPEENFSIVNKELQELMLIEQDLPIIPIALSAFNDIELTMEQMNAIMFMVEED